MADEVENYVSRIRDYISLESTPSKKIFRLKVDDDGVLYTEEVVP